MMNYLRQFADAGIGLIVVAAVARTKDKRGRSSYASDGLNLASFRESSELEFGADDAYILMPEPKTADVMILRHLKSRHGETRDIRLSFDKPHQRFTPIESTAGTPEPPGKLTSAIAGLWDQTPPAEGDDE
jgi:replicative DNA helicase